MALHTVLIAVTVDDKHSTYAVASEFKYFLPFITSECLDTVTAVIPARIKKQVQTYQVWNAEHISMLGFKVECFDDLVKVEEDTGNSFSSYITTDDIDSIVNAVQNEWNGDLQYELLEDA